MSAARESCAVQRSLQAVTRTTTSDAVTEVRTPMSAVSPVQGPARRSRSRPGLAIHPSVTCPGRRMSSNARVTWRPEDQVSRRRTRRARPRPIEQPPEAARRRTNLTAPATAGGVPPAVGSRLAVSVAVQRRAASVWPSRARSLPCRGTLGRRLQVHRSRLLKAA